MEDWTFGENVVERDSKAKLRACGFPDADRCGKPVEHKGNIDVYEYTVDGKTTMCETETAWIRGYTWGEL